MYICNCGLSGSREKKITKFQWVRDRDRKWKRMKRKPKYEKNVDIYNIYKMIGRINMLSFVQLSTKFISLALFSLSLFVAPFHTVSSMWGLCAHCQPPPNWLKLSFCTNWCRWQWNWVYFINNSHIYFFSYMYIIVSLFMCHS